MYKYRVRAVRPDVYRVEKKRWYGLWTNYMTNFDGWDFGDATFKSPREAQDACVAMHEKKRIQAEHISQAPWYFGG